MSTQAASTRPMNRPTQEAPSRAAMQEAPTRPMPMMEDGRRQAMQAPGSETKQSLKTTEFWIYAGSVAAVLIASYLVGKNADGVDIFRAPQAWFYITILTVAYLGSRGLAKAGSAFRSSEERKARH